MKLYNDQEQPKTATLNEKGVKGVSIDRNCSTILYNKYDKEKYTCGMTLQSDARGTEQRWNGRRGHNHD